MTGPTDGKISLLLLCCSSFNFGMNFVVNRVTSGSMPPPTQFGGTFFGDYNALDAMTDAHPVWMDTRDPELFLCPGTGTTTTPPAVCAGNASNASIANDQDIFTAALPVPSK